MENLNDVINYMIYKGEGKYSPKQINRFLYFAYAIYLAKYNDDLEEPVNRLFKAEFKAYPRGPIIEEANNYLEANRNRYFQYDENSRENIKSLKQTEDIINNKEKFVIDAVLKVYGKYSGNQLELMVNKEDPYKKTYKKNRLKKIKEEMIFEYYAKNYKEDYKPKRKCLSLFNKPKII